MLIVSVHTAHQGAVCYFGCMSENTFSTSNDGDLDLLDDLSTDEIALLEGIFKDADDFDLSMLSDFVDTDADNSKEDFVLGNIFAFMKLAESIDNYMRPLDKFGVLLGGAMTLCTGYTVEIDEAVTYFNKHTSRVRDSVATLNKSLSIFNRVGFAKEYLPGVNDCANRINIRMNKLNEDMSDINEHFLDLKRYS